MKEIVVILDNIRSIHNVGSIFRTADGVGVKKIYLCGITPEPVDRWGKKRSRFVKVSLGAEDYVEWEKFAITAKAINKLEKEGYLICAVEQARNSIPYNKLDSRFRGNDKSFDMTQDKIALVLGEEVNGLKSAILKKADHILEIPMHGKKESLNVSVAFGIVVFSLLKTKD